MKILILTSTSKRHNYFAIKVANSFKEDKIFVIQEPKSSKGKNKSKLHKFLRHKYKFKLLINLIINFMFRKYLKKVAIEKKKAEDSYFSQYDSSSLNIIAEVENGKSVNDSKYIKIMQEVSPDIIVVMGTSLIKNEIINIAKLGILNIHTGVSPYYRGGMTNFWPFIYNELQYCGVTVHKLDIGIDSGDIIYHGFINITKDDTYSTINCKAIVEGTKLMITAIEKLKEGSLKSIKQEKIGKLFFNRDYNGYYAFKYIVNYKKIIWEYLDKDDI